MLGCDIIEIERIEKSILKFGDNFLKHILSDNEIALYNKRGKKAEFAAGRFAAKEAAFKALSCEILDKYEIEWKSIEVINDQDGRPQIVLDKEKITTSNIQNIDISLSHCKQYAMAQVVVLWKE